MMQLYTPVNYVLSTAVSFKKQEMIDLGTKYGLSDSRTIECSQELDELLNQYENAGKSCVFTTGIL